MDANRGTEDLARIKRIAEFDPFGVVLELEETVDGWPLYEVHRSHMGCGWKPAWTKCTGPGSTCNPECGLVFHELVGGRDG